MERILYLNDKTFPDLFYKHPIYKNNNSFNIENRIVDKINEYNFKLNIKSIEYGDVKATSGLKDSGKFFGLILDVIDINVVKMDLPILKLDKGEFYYKIFGYIFISNNEEVSRSALFSQTIFPELITIINDSLDSPNFKVSNKPIYLINLIATEIKASYLLQELYLMKLFGIEIVNIFNEWMDDSVVIENFKSFDKIFHGSNLDDIYEYNSIKNDFVLKLDRFNTGLEKVDGEYKVKGSNEKFYWIRALGLTLLAINSNLMVDLSLINDFNNKYSNEITNQSKFKRTQILFEYLEKLKKGKEYFDV